MNSGAAFAPETTPTFSQPTYSLPAAAEWLAEQQLPDGGFPGPSGASDVETTINAVALGSRVLPFSVLDRARRYLLAIWSEYAARGSVESARLALLLIAMDLDINAFPGVDPSPVDSSEDCPTIGWLVAADAVPNLAPSFAAPGSDTLPGLFGDDLRDHAMVILAYDATYTTVPESALELLLTTQAMNGGWARDGSTAPGAADAQTTALVLQAIIDDAQFQETRIGPRLERRALQYLRSLQAPEGGFAYSKKQPFVADATSTALVLQALIAVGEDPTAPEWGNVPLALSRFQDSSGGFRSQVTDAAPSVQTTLQVIPALEGFSLPLRHVCDG